MARQGKAGVCLMPAKPSGEPGWKWRRIIIFPAAAYSAFELHRLTSLSPGSVNELLCYVHGWLLAAEILGYAGLATVQDVSAIWATKSGRPYQQEMQPADPERVGDSIPDPAKPE